MIPRVRKIDVTHGVDCHSSRVPEINIRARSIEPSRSGIAPDKTRNITYVKKQTTGIKTIKVNKLGVEFRYLALTNM
jgi:hypothetical protein